ncbi:MAG: hypothetical protein PHY93_05305 [Bacteriovorax sp.]|nr:hypothetical protein [Bacteriovorax sp.]
MRKSLFFVFLFLIQSLSLELKAESRAVLFLRAYVPASISTKVNESRLSATQSLWLISSLTNSRYPSESQKIEVEGLDQVGIEAHIKKVVGVDRTIQYEVLINRLKSSMPVNKPIFLKISAN